DFDASSTCCIVGLGTGPAFANDATASSATAMGSFIAWPPRWSAPAYRRAARTDSRRSPPSALLGVEPTDELAHVRIDDVAPAAAAEDAVVARARDFDVRAVALRDAAAQVMRGARLADAGDVVEFAFDGQQGGL